MKINHNTLAMAERQLCLLREIIDEHLKDQPLPQFGSRVKFLIDYYEKIETKIQTAEEEQRLAHAMKTDAEDESLENLEAASDKLDELKENWRKSLWTAQYENNPKSHD